MDEQFTVIFYENEKQEKPALEFLNTLDVKLRAKAFHDLQLLQQKGNELRLPYSRHLEDDIFELRTIQGNNIIRCLYFFMVGKQIIVTHGFRKKTQKTPPEEIAKAKDYRSKYLVKIQQIEKSEGGKKWH